MSTSKDDREAAPAGVSRRGFLTGFGAGAAGAAGAAGVGLVDPAGVFAQHRDPQTRPDRFSRIFDLPPFAEASSAVVRALREIGSPDGPMNAQDPLHEGPIRLITNPELSPDNLDTPHTPRARRSSVSSSTTT